MVKRVGGRVRVCQVCGATGGSCNETMQAIANRANTLTRPDKGAKGVSMGQAVSKRTWYWNTDKTEVVPEGDDRARFLLVRAGSPIDPLVADQYGIEYDVVNNTISAPRPEVGFVAGSPEETTEQKANRLRIEATRRITHETAERTALATDAGTGRQVSSMIEGQVAGELNASAAESTTTGANTRTRNFTDPATALRELDEGSKSGEELLAKNQMGKPEGGGGEDQKAIDARREEEARLAEERRLKEERVASATQTSETEGAGATQSPQTSASAPQSGAGEIATQSGAASLPSSTDAPRQ